MKRLIVTGDDFGLAVPVNEAIELAHRNGILSAASLMVGAAATIDAVERARQLPKLRVGLHLVVVEGRPVLPAAHIPDLVQADGTFPNQLIRSGLRFFLKPGIRRQLESEIRAQFQAFRSTGLELDHVNAHNHMHLHPTVLGLILRIGKEFGMRAMRIPYEPPLRSWDASLRGLLARLTASAGLAPWTAWMRRRLRRNGMVANDYLYGLNDTGHMQESLVMDFIRNLPQGTTELCFHPAARRCAELEAAMPDYQNEAELAVLTSPHVQALLEHLGLVPTGYRDLPVLMASPGRMG